MYKKLFFFSLFVFVLTLKAMHEDPLDDSSEIIKNRLRSTVDSLRDTLREAEETQKAVSCLNESQTTIAICDGKNKQALIYLEQGHLIVPFNEMTIILDELMQEEISPRSDQGLLSHKEKKQKKKCFLS